MIVDTHCHVTTSDKARYPTLEKPPAWPETTGDKLAADMQACGIDRAVLVQTYFTYGYDNRYMTDAAAAHPTTFSSVCVLDPLAKDAPRQLSDLVRHHGVRGIRLMNDRAHNVISLDDPATFPLWEAIEDLGITVCIAALIDDAPRVRVALERFPKVKVAMDHIWGLKTGDGPHFDLVQPLMDLADHPNLHIKIAVNNSFAVREAKAAPEDFFGMIVRKFGADRIMWGSNFPAHSQIYGSLPERLALAQEDLAFLDASDRALILGGTALKLWPGLAIHQPA